MDASRLESSSTLEFDVFVVRLASMIEIDPDLLEFERDTGIFDDWGLD